ncbi:MAG: RNA polymerase sigma-70 factor [Chitinophagaceae bacterium]|nr:RNA polymerase sigma-70 factor [Chitinophagaceae bacterium]MCW5926028.1 RNA polymerase sigma-70 factor [Chitinophagaceae bacterium]
MSCKSPFDETYLLNLAAGGDRDAFRMLYDLHRDKLYFYALRLTESKQLAEDVLQEVFIRIWLDKERLHEIRSLDAWLFTLAKNKIINGFRRLSKEHSILSEINKDLPHFSDSTTQSVDYNEMKRALQSAIEQLPPQQKIIYRLRREQGLKNDEIALQLNISPLTVKKHISQASRALRSLVEKQMGITVSLLVTLFQFFQ